MDKVTYAKYCIERAAEDQRLFEHEPQLIPGWTYSVLRRAYAESIRHAQDVVEMLTGKQCWLNTLDELRKHVEEFENK